ncbi:MAG: hypothetical protein KDG54_20305, partial [Geminicoccaceae bacterium]|nr:hypothetical protein [Geminicoccaceae bacterium]
MARDYLTPEPWLSEVHRFLAARPRDAGNPEHATVLRADLERAGLCDGEDDWLVLSNRLVVDHAVHLVDGET